MTDIQVKTNGALAVYGSRDEVRELVARLRSMLPGGEKLNDGQIKALAQGSIAHGLDPLNGEIWMIPGRGLMVGVKGLRKKAREQVKGNFWIEFVALTNAEERAQLRIPQGALAYEARLFDSENITTYTTAVQLMLKAGIPWEGVKEMVGSRPYTVGIGVLKAGEQTKMEPAQCAMKRAEADALKRRFDVPFGLAVESDAEPEPVEYGGEWVEGEGRVITEPTTTSAERQPEREAVYGSDAENAGYAGKTPEPPPAENKPTPPAAVKRAALNIKDRANLASWQAGCKQIAANHLAYQGTTRGEPNGEPNMFHILGAAAKCGFATVDDGNYQVVLEQVNQRAAEKVEA